MFDVIRKQAPGSFARYNEKPVKACLRGTAFD